MIWEAQSRSLLFAHDLSHSHRRFQPDARVAGEIGERLDDSADFCRRTLTARGAHHGLLTHCVLADADKSLQTAVFTTA